MEGIFNYLRHKKQFPTVWCSGCGNGTIMNILVRRLAKLGYDKNDVVIVSGIGCSSRMPVYLDFHTVHTTHGRAIPFATGIKMFNPKMKVIIITGDGDGLAIGGNHMIHACRRNIDITVLLVNNFIYGMTGGQVSPTTPYKSFCYTSPYGNFEAPFDVVKLVKGAGATFIARSTTYHVFQLAKLMEKAITHKGFSVLDIYSQCPTLYGRLNKIKSPIDSLNYFKENGITLQAAKKKSPEELQGKFLTGIFKQKEVPEYSDVYWELTRRADEQRKE